MPLWTDAYLGDTTHLTTIEHGAYLLLLITAWRSKAHCLPDDNKLLCQYCKLDHRQWRRIRPRLEAFFEINSGYWFHLRLLDEIDTLKRIRAKRSVSGSIGALKRWHRNTDDGTRNTVLSRQLRKTHLDSTSIKSLKSNDVAVANAVANEWQMHGTHTHIDKKEETDKDRKEAVKGIASDHLKECLQRKGWINSH
jgi:uncharacterized protein YdaU (DUF1376 family)